MEFVIVRKNKGHVLKFNINHNQFVNVEFAQAGASGTWMVACTYNTDCP